MQSYECAYRVARNGPTDASRSFPAASIEERASPPEQMIRCWGVPRHRRPRPIKNQRLPKGGLIVTHACGATMKGPIARRRGHLYLY